MWTGCPRLALGEREAQWIRWWDRTGGKLTATELLHAPLLLADAFDILDENEAQRRIHEAERMKQKG